MTPPALWARRTLGFACWLSALGGSGCDDAGEASQTGAGGAGNSSANAGGAGGAPPVGVCPDGSCGLFELCGTCEADCGVCAGAAIAVTRGPYLQSETSSSIVVRWRTAEPSDSVVAYGADPDALTLTARGADATTEHEVLIEGLSAATKYHYAVGTPESPLIGGDADHFFVTAPTTGTQRNTRIWVLGDAGTQSSDQEDVRDAYVSYTGARGTDLILMLGDNAYADGTDAEYQGAVFDIYGDTLRNTVLWSTLGNHDGHTANSSTQTGPYYDILTLPKAAEAGGVASGTEAYYAFDYGTVHFVCLDSYESDRAPGGDMLTWLESDLTANAQPWLVAFFHHPPYSKGSHDSDTESELEEMRQNALPILESFGVDLVLSGHSHAYERSMFVSGHYGVSTTLSAAMIIDSGDGRASGDGAYTRAVGSDAGAAYVVAGSSGQTSGGSLDHPAMFISLNELGSLVVDVDGGSMDVAFVDDAGAVRDSFTLSKNGL